jgi:drug/metabolite transporter (DMT)-like permease
VQPINLAIALIGAMLLGTGFVLQQRAAEAAPQAHFLRLALFADLIRRRRWLLGIAVMVAGQLCSAWAVSHLALSLAEPLLSTNLLFALALAVPLSGQRLRAIEIAGAILLAGGVAALSVARTAKAPSESFWSSSGWLGAAIIAGIAVVFVYAGQRRRGQLRATLTGTAAGLIFGISDALTRRTVQIIDTHPFTMLLTTWPGYSVVAAGLVGVWLMQSAFNAAPLHASLPGISAAEPLAGIALGVVVFGDRIRISPPMLALQAAGIAALVCGVILVARAPALSQIKRAAEVAVHPVKAIQDAGHQGQGHAPEEDVPLENVPDISPPIGTRTGRDGPASP